MKPADVLVLGVGGILGEAWMSAVLAGLEEDGFDSRECGGFVGSSAGSIVAASLAGGVSPGSRLGELPEQPPVDAGEDDGGSPGALRRVMEAASAPIASLALSWATPGGALVRRLALSRVPAGRRSLGGLGQGIARLGLDWDGRLRIAAVEVESGRRVVFGAPGAPEISVADAVLASCAIPGVFQPVEACGRTYVDGGAWSPTNMDAAEVSRGDSVLCLNPTAAIGALGPVSRSIAGAEALVLKRRGATVETVNPDRGSAAAMGSNLMRSEGRADVIAAGLAQGRRLARSTRVE